MEQPTAVRRPPFSSAELDRVEDDFVLLLEDVRWKSDEEHCLVPYRVMHKLQRRGHSWARSEAMLNRLVERGALELRHHILKYQINFDPMKYFTTSPRWFTYLTQRQSQKVVTGPLITQSEELAGPIANSPLRVEGHATCPTLVEATVPSKLEDSPLRSGDEEVFADFSPKQRKLLTTLRSKPLMSIPAVKDAVYGTKNKATKTLEQLVARANRRLAETNLHLKIKRKSNGLRLQAI